MPLESRQKGVTIFELMVTLIVAAILLSIAVPSFSNLYDKNRVKGAAEELSAQLQFARSEAIARNINVSVSVMGGADWCIGVVEEAASCDCSASPTDCQVDGVDRVTDGNDFSGVTMPAGNNDVTFDSVRGMPAGGGAVAFTLESGEGKRIGVNVNPIGRVRLCSPSGDANLWEYPEC